MGLGKTYRLLPLTKRLPLLRNQLGPLDNGDVPEIAAGLAIGEEVEVRRHGPFDVAFILDRRPFRPLALLELGLATERGSGEIGDPDLLHRVRFYPAFVLGLLGFAVGVG